MKSQLLENFEEKFYFKTSHLFWHLLSGLGGLALLGGVLVFLWGLTPSMKPDVKKPAYPTPIQVNAAEIKQQLTPPAASDASTRTTTYSPPAAQEQRSAQVASTDSTLAAYRASYDSLKILLPPAQFRWQTVGHWEQTWWEKKWVVDALGIDDRLQSAYEKTNARNPVAAKQLLDAYRALLALFPVDQRVQVLRAAIEFTKDDVSTSVYNVSLLRAAVKNFSTSNADFIETLSAFGKKNPRDGRRFIEYANTILPKFDALSRPPALKTLASSYYNYFNDISKQEEATNLFVVMLNEFEPGQQAKALAEYYQLYRDRNYAREQEIAALESHHQSELNAAEMVVAEKRAKKATLRAWSWKIMAGSFVTVAFLALFLVLLSIQRNIKMMREMAVASK